MTSKPSAATLRLDRTFRTKVWEHYHQHGRHDLPWRATKNPYRILLSEVMLQQTQAARVIPKYRAFLRQFPTAQALAEAPLGEVLKAWQGLGYNRRAKSLQAAARAIVHEHGGRFPRTYEELVALPGIGPYTAAAVLAFAYNKAVPLIETNLRTVYLHHYCAGKTDVSDEVLLLHIVRTLDHDNPREWYYALMDYGAHLKQTIGNQNTRATTYTRQSRFAGSDRQIRGAIVRSLASRTHSTKSLRTALAQFDPLRIDAQLERLLAEGMVVKKRGRYQLPNH